MTVNNHSPFLKDYSKKLLNFNFSTCFLQFSNQAICIGLANTFLNGLGSAVNQVLGFFQSKTSQVLNDLHYVQFICTGCFQNNIKRCFFFSGRSSSAGSGATSNSNSCSSRFDTVLFFQDFCEFINFFNSQGYQLFCEYF